MKISKNEIDGYDDLENEIEMQQSAQDCVGIPKIVWHGIINRRAIIAMQLLGQSLYGIWEQRNFRFNLQTTCKIAIQMISRLEDLHKRNIIHGDIKLENIVAGVGNEARILYLIDFGLAMPYKNQETGAHLPAGEQPFYGTAVYASVNAHNDKRLSRRDDLESLCYVLICFATGSELPWESAAARLAVDQNLMHAELANKKLIHEWTDLPQEFIDFLQYTRTLGYDKTPLYALLRKMFEELIVKIGGTVDNQFEWLQ